MAKEAKKEELKKVLDEVTLTKEQIDAVGKLKGKVFMDFMKLSENPDEVTESALFDMFVKRSLEPLGIVLEDPGEQLDFPTYSQIMLQVMEKNNLTELFQAFERLNRNASIGESKPN